MRWKRRLTDGKDRDQEIKDTVKEKEESEKQRDMESVADNTTEIFKVLKTARLLG